MIVFSHYPGRVVKIVGNARPCKINIFSLHNDNITLEKHSAIVTNVRISQSVNKQFLHTVGNHIYMYVFGDKIGTINIGGLAFATTCDNCNEKNITNDKSGIEKVIEWYNNNKASSRELPITITIGRDTVFRGFLVDMSIELTNPEMNITAWSMTIHTVPNK